MTFDTLLIANRGEIACRIIATAKRLGLRTVAVFSEADAGARHVEMADQAVPIGPAPAAESYLRGDAILRAALDTGAQAIHPGYGFLSENPDFVETVEQAGLTFVGPTASAIRAMGLKDAAKALMERARVPIVPGYHGEDQDPARLAAEADRIGYPVLIKARAGGGGKGMRLANRPDEFAEALASAQREAQAAFGDPACLIEKYITQPRHIEIQVFGDAHGNVVHLFERDCSLQRRHQKVIEEAPAPGMTPAVRQAMGQAAVEAAKAIGYCGAGTVEFIVDGSGPLRPDGFWFMEMNTRLQVEHPVSEAITRIDFVELQLRIAAGETLPFAQDDLEFKGHAFEARLYAEDPTNDFLPATGTLDHLAFPTEAKTFALGATRVDGGVRLGDTISPFYDPMVAKIIAHGPTRQAALQRLARALDDTHVAGCTTNLDFLGALTRHAGFAAGQVDTGLIARDMEALQPPPDPPTLAWALAALGALGGLGLLDSTAPPLMGFRHWGRAEHQVRLNDATCGVAIMGANDFAVATPTGEIALSVTATGATGLKVTTQDHSQTADLATGPGWVSVRLSGRSYAFTLPDPLATGTQDMGQSDTILAPMPGLVKRVHTAPGDSVQQGETLLVLEAMKMEHSLCAPRDGVVAQVLTAADQQVGQGDALLSLEPADD